LNKTDMETEQYTLTPTQQQIFNAIETTRNNFLIMGKPGTGKSVLTRAIWKDGQKKYTLCSPTGLAAVNIGGWTLHSVFRIPVSRGIIHPNYTQYPKDERTLDSIRYGIKTLIIDECSMVRADIFDYIDRLLRYVKGDNRPFGGIQVVLVGDFFQLAPVAVREERSQLKEYGYRSEFIFDSHVWKDANFQTILLTEVLRQKGDAKFIEFLHKARTGDLSPTDLKALDKLVGNPTNMRISLTGTNRQADEINGQHLASINEPARQFTAEVYGNWPAFPVDEKLSLKVGAQVMVRMNKADVPPGTKAKDADSKVVNGTIGKVTGFADDGSYVTILTETGHSVNIYRRTWELKIKKKQEDDRWHELVVASFTQIPLSLAWAISIHKSQGQTFEQVHIDATKIFAAGQLYVALSRCRTLEGISLQQRLTTNKFWPNKAVINFYNENNLEP